MRRQTRVGAATRDRRARTDDLRRALGNRAVLRSLGGDGSVVQRQPDAPQPAASALSTVDCSAQQASELAAALPLAIAMVEKAIRVVGGPSSPAADNLLLWYFRDSGPGGRLHALMGYQDLLAGLTAGPTFECEHRGSPLYDRMCPPGAYGYMWPLPWTNIHLCESAFGLSTEFLAFAIIHESSHKYLWALDWAYCPYGCSASLPPWQAASNADSYARFARRAYQTLP
jgi:hypothetical protein